MSRLGTTKERGYGMPHVSERRRWAPVVAAGETYCTICRRLIYPGTSWDLHHTADRSGWVGPAHSRCNRRAGAKLGAAVTNARRAFRRRQSRRW